MAETLADEARRVPGLERVADSVAAYDFAASPARARLEDGRTISARLVIGADGRDSKARRAAGLEARVHAYGQSALTVFLSHRLPHRGFSTEFHTPGGPFTLVPLPASAAAPHRSSLVWVMTDKDARRRAALDNKALADEIERQAQSLLGAMRIEGERGIFPMTRQIVPRIVAGRLALVGDAAHVFPPLGAQGLNLGLRDVQAIIACAVEAREAGRDIGGPESSERLRTLEAVRYRAADRHGRRTEPRLAGPFRSGRLRPRRGIGGAVRDRAAPALGHARGPRSSHSILAPEVVDAGISAGGGHPQPAEVVRPARGVVGALGGVGKSGMGHAHERAALPVEEVDLDQARPRRHRIVTLPAEAVGEAVDGNDLAELSARRCGRAARRRP